MVFSIIFLMCEKLKKIVLDTVTITTKMFVLQQKLQVTLLYEYDHKGFDYITS